MQREEGRRGLRGWFGWIVAIVILAACLWLLDWRDILAALGRLGPLQIGLVLGLLTLDRMLMGVRWGQLLRLGGIRLPFARAVAIYYQGSFVGSLMPSHVGGDLLRAWLVGRSSGNHHTSFASLVIERLIGFLSAVNWACFGAIVLVATLDPGRFGLWVGLGLAAIVAGNGLFVVSQHPRVHAFVLDRLARGRQRRLVGLVHDFYEAYSRFGRDLRGLAVNFLLTMVEQGVQMTAVLVVAHALEVALPMSMLFAAAALYLLAVRIPIAPDGWGVGEVAAIGAFGLLGVPAETAFVLSLTMHALLLVAILPGLLFLRSSKEHVWELLERAGNVAARLSGRAPSYPELQVQPARGPGEP